MSKIKRTWSVVASALIALSLGVASMTAPVAASAALDVTPPAATTRLVFIHHSTGQAWLEDGYGNLASALGDNNYYVSDTNYGWGPAGIGDYTDVGHWWTWFRGPSAGTYTSALYANDEINSGYSRSLSDPGGPNTVVMFKSCFPNSAIDGSPSDAVPPIGSNPLKGNSGPLTVGNAKGVYLDLLLYFAAHPETLFVLVASPPLRSSDTNATQASNARYLADWLVDPAGYLSGYTTGNVFVFDYYTVLTGGHHRIVGGAVDHTPGPTNYLAFPTGDSHPSAAGDQIATNEFVPMLNAAHNGWNTGAPPDPRMPVYRFYNMLNGSHFYTADASEKARVQRTLSSTYSLDGVGYRVNTTNPANCARLYRFYNRLNGSHFYTVDVAEKNRVQTTLSATYGYDGEAYSVCSAPIAGADTVWRFYNKLNGSHFYTVDPVEKARIIRELSGTYALDGAAFYLAP